VTAPSRAGLEQLLRELGLGDAAIFTGFVEDIAQMYAALDAFVFPSQCAEGGDE